MNCLSYYKPYVALNKRNDEVLNTSSVYFINIVVFYIKTCVLKLNIETIQTFRTDLQSNNFHSEIELKTLKTVGEVIRT